MRKACRCYAAVTRPEKRPRNEPLLCLQHSLDVSTCGIIGIAFSARILYTKHIVLNK